ncbi:hypothetical protein ABB25_13020 [Stenotrophomonas koreensis]|uniref:Uncharacterized protein n=1 Tax=Stenotrophomonas koreensis TaxID=266128 RepID=A0A0R0BPF0_9GAMM|nr:hypothetical protein [Stenotrophomonas koreensis]KRG54995.1 hypothetical protein ABB25_13020 [Stenotrophomonas koreensis]
MRSNSTPATKTTPPSPGDGLPEGLRTRYADTLANAHTLAQAEGLRFRVPVGVAQDRAIRAVLDEASASGANPSAATVAAYQRDHARLRAAGGTPLDHAGTRAHFDRLRSACRWVEADEIRRLRTLAETARKARDLDAMRGYTLAAFERAMVYRALYLAQDRPTWAQKAHAMRAAGLRQVSKSKRFAGRRALSPDRLLVALGQQPGRCARVEALAMVFALFGIRPAEATRGLAMEKTAIGLRLAVAGAKVDAVRGQPLRVLEVEPTRRGQSAIAVAFLRAYVDATGGDMDASRADVVAVRRAMRQVQPGLSPYAYRHARASDAKASQGRAGAAAWLGHSNDRTQQGYGHARSAKGAVTIKAATASRPVRQTKTLPPTLAERLAQVATRLAARTSSQSAQKASPPRRRTPRPGW